jgi:hypothetical protein
MYGTTNSFALAARSLPLAFTLRSGLVMFSVFLFSVFHLGYLIHGPFLGRASARASPSRCLGRWSRTFAGSWASPALGNRCGIRVVFVFVIVILVSVPLASTSVVIIICTHSDCILALHRDVAGVTSAWGAGLTGSGPADSIPCASESHCVRNQQHPRRKFLVGLSVRGIKGRRSREQMPAMYPWQVVGRGGVRQLGSVVRIPISSAVAAFTGKPHTAHHIPDTISIWKRDAIDSPTGPEYLAVVSVIFYHEVFVCREDVASFLGPCLEFVRCIEDVEIVTHAERLTRRRGLSRSGNRRS